MTRRFFRLLTCCLLAWLVHATSYAASESIEIKQAQLATCEDGYCMSAKFKFDLHPSLKDAISRGMPLYFTTEVELTRPRWYWFDEHAVSIKQTTRISYNVLTRQYSVSVIGSLRQNFRTLEEALMLVQRPFRWVISERGQLTAGEKYSVGVHVLLDVSRLPKPFQVHALNSRKWRLSSDWKRFLYTAEK